MREGERQHVVTLHLLALRRTVTCGHIRTLGPGFIVYR